MPDFRVLAQVRRAPFSGHLLFSHQVRLAISAPIRRCPYHMMPIGKPKSSSAIFFCSFESEA